MQHHIHLRDVQVGQRIGCGALGEVRRGTYEGERVALKSLHLLRTDAESVAAMGTELSPAERRAQLEVFQRECDTMRALVHPNILPFIGVVVESATNVEPLYLATQYVESGTLHDLVHGEAHAPMRSDRGCLPLTVQLTTFFGMFAGLAYLAEQRLIHRDIKPTNILVVVEARQLVKVLLCDFGESKQLTMTMTRVAGTAAGTPLYMAPEMALEDVAKGSAADVFSAGVVVCEVSTGRRPQPGPPWRQQGRERVAVPEEERRAADLAAVRHEAVAALAARCIVDHQDARASASELVAWCTDLMIIGDCEAVARRIKLFVKNISDGRTITVAANTTTTVLQLKELVARQTELSAAKQMLVFCGRKLKDSHTIDDHNIQDGTTLHVIQQHVAQHAVAQALPSKHEPPPASASRPSAASAETSLGIGAELKRAMEQHGLIATEQEQLYREGVTDLQLFEWLRDEDFSLSGIDIVARRAAKLVRDREAAETQHVQALADQAQSLLDEAGLSAVGRAQLRSLPSIEAVRRLDKRSMAEVHSLNIKDRQALFAFLQTARFQNERPVVKDAVMTEVQRTQQDARLAATHARRQEAAQRRRAAAWTLPSAESPVVAGMRPPTSFDDVCDRHGLTAADVAMLRHGGVSTLDDFLAMEDEDFQIEGIDIAQRRREKLQHDRVGAAARHSEQLLTQVQQLLDGVGLSPAGRKITEEEKPRHLSLTPDSPLDPARPRSICDNENPPLTDRTVVSFPTAGRECVRDVADLDTARRLTLRSMRQAGLGTVDRRRLEEFLGSERVRSLRSVAREKVRTEPEWSKWRATRPEARAAEQAEQAEQAERVIGSVVCMVCGVVLCEVGLWSAYSDLALWCGLLTGLPLLLVGMVSFDSGMGALGVADWVLKRPYTDEERREAIARRRDAGLCGLGADAMRNGDRWGFRLVGSVTIMVIGIGLSIGCAVCPWTGTGENFEDRLLSSERGCLVPMFFGGVMGSLPIAVVMQSVASTVARAQIQSTLVEQVEQVEQAKRVIGSVVCMVCGAVLCEVGLWWGCRESDLALWCGLLTGLPLLLVGMVSFDSGMGALGVADWVLKRPYTDEERREANAWRRDAGLGELGADAMRNEDRWGFRLVGSVTIMFIGIGLSAGFLEAGCSSVVVFGASGSLGIAITAKIARAASGVASGQIQSTLVGEP